jgi:hypothetical protein
MALPAIEGQNLEKPLCYDPKRDKFIRFDEIVSGKEKIIPVEQLSQDDLQKLVIERQRRGPDYQVQVMNAPPKTRDDIIRAIENHDEIGRMTLEAETAYLKELLRQIQNHLDEHPTGRKPG